ncbi:MAG: DUF192 domain-containing protein [Terracidiphilus sp.]|jgi:uncharacterized membrane protein (UPF0127 family)
MNPLKKMISLLRSLFAARRQDAPQICLRILNVTRNTELAAAMVVAASGPKRNKGLLGRAGLAEGEGLWIVPCEAIHTFWMQFPIDLVYLDRQKRIKKLVSDVPPWRLSGCLTAHSVFELPSGTIRRTQTQLGDELDILASE